MNEGSLFLRAVLACGTWRDAEELVEGEDAWFAALPAWSSFSRGAL